jgi:hypothetical protein
MLPIRNLQSISEKFEIIKGAILAKHPISAVYDGRTRLLCPHVLGEDKEGNYQGLFYQYGGDSNSRPIQPDGSSENWRCLALAKLSRVAAIAGGERWHTAPDHSRPQTCVKRIHVEVRF